MVINTLYFNKSRVIEIEDFFGGDLEINRSNKVKIALVFLLPFLILAILIHFDVSIY